MTCSARKAGGTTWGCLMPINPQEQTPLKPLHEWNKERRDIYDHLQRLTRNAKLNGLACPMCRSELYDDGECVTKGLGPTEVTVRCPVCDFSGGRLT